MNRTFAALFVVGFSFLALAGIHSGVANAAEDEVAAADLDDGLLRWILRSRWWRQAPEQPALPTLSDISHDSLTVFWTAPESTVFKIVDYDVQYRAANAAGFVDWVHDGMATQTTITGLAEITEYRVRVRAQSEAGEGDWSAPASGTTLLAPPVFVEGESADRQVEENAAAGEVIGEPVAATVREGELRYSLAGADADAFVIDVSTGQLRTRQGVQYDHETRPSYAAEVEASHARAGTGRIAVRIAVLDVDEPPDKPAAPAVSALGSTGLRVDWDAPKNTGPAISGYDVEYRERGTEDYLDAGHEDTQTRATITGLARQTLYEVRVRGVNDEGTGAWSDTAQGGTQGGGGGGTAPTPPPTPPPSGSPDLVVESVSANDTQLDGGDPFTLNATVRNQGDVAAAATTLRYYRSSNAIISTTDTQVGSDSVDGLAANGVSNESIGLTTPLSPGTYHYGACADSVAGESNVGNNCSNAVQITVKPSGPSLAPADETAFDALFAGNFLSTESYFIQFFSGGRFRELDQDPGDYAYANTGPNTGTVTQTYDDTNTYGGSCTIQLTFVSSTSGTSSYDCVTGQGVTEAWRRDTVDSSSFNIELIWASDRPGSVDSAFRTAVARWESIIAANINAVYVSGRVAFGVIDDLRIYARVAVIDGASGTLAIAGTRYVRVSSKLPAVSRVTLDEDDVSGLSATDLHDLIVHEIAHALGFGTVWEDLGLLSGSGLDTHFNGANAIAAFDAAGGSGYAREKVPVDGDGGHWPSSVFGGNEVMIGTLIRGASQRAVSAITVQSMADVGYTVNAGAADGYTLPSSNSPTMPALARGATPKNWIPLKCIVTRPLPTDGVTLIELKSLGDP